MVLIVTDILVGYGSMLTTFCPVNKFTCLDIQGNCQILIWMWSPSKYPKIQKKLNYLKRYVFSDPAIRCEDDKIELWQRLLRLC